MLKAYDCRYGLFEIRIHARDLEDVIQALDDCLYVIRRQVAFTALPRAQDFLVQEVIDN